MTKTVETNTVDELAFGDLKLQRRGGSKRSQLIARPGAAAFGGQLLGQRRPLPRHVRLDGLDERNEAGLITDVLEDGIVTDVQLPESKSQMPQFHYPLQCRQGIHRPPLTHVFQRLPIVVVGGGFKPKPPQTFKPGDSEAGAAQVAVSASGHLAYARGGVYPETPVIAVRVTSSGDTIPLELDRREYSEFRVSPEGNRLAFIARTRGAFEIWVHDLIRGTNDPVSTGGFFNCCMAWSPDGQSLAFSSDRDQAVWNVYRVPVDESGEPERLAPSERPQMMFSWSSQGVMAWLQSDSTAVNIWVLPPDSEPAPFFTSEDGEFHGTFSPDGQWLAYTGFRSGRPEVYVRPYPGPHPATRISVDGGWNPAWSRDGRQIYYTWGGVLMAVDVTPGRGDFQRGRPAPLIEPWTSRCDPVRCYDILPDGSFVTTVAVAEGRPLERFGTTEIQVVLNWFEELKARVGN